jgi:hydrogenase maturation protein HypF
MSTEYAKTLARSGIRLTAVQHHHAHAAACMGENHLEGPVIALTLDGTGLGTDRHIWGGEILVCTLAGFARKAQLSYIHMPGGDKAALEPWRMAASVLFHVFGPDFSGLSLPWIESMDGRKLEFICRMMEKQVHVPLTSSAGRLFDAVASLTGICHVMTHEAQAAMALETLARAGGSACQYSFDIQARGQAYNEMDVAPCIRKMVTDLARGLAVTDISAGFHDALVQAFVRTAARVGKDTGIHRAVLSGGVFNNRQILEKMVAGLERKGFCVYTHTQVPAGDGGISLGQVLVAAAGREK